MSEVDHTDALAAEYVLGTLDSDEREQARALSQLVEDLSDRDREFLGAYLQGFEPEQIAAQLGISVSTVYSKKHKILARLEQAACA